MNSDRENSPVKKPSCETARAVSASSAEMKNRAVTLHTPKISYSGKKRPKRRFLRRLIMPLFILFIGFAVLRIYAERQLAPEIRELAEARAEKYLLETVNQAVGELVRTGEIRYDGMVRTVRDAAGEVIYLEVDTAMLAGAQAKIVSRIDESLEKERTIVLSVPLGSLMKNSFFSGAGMPVRVRLFPIGMTKGEIDTALEDCGINQTRHLIRVHVRAKILIVLPGENAQVETEITVPLGERVLVGDVPEIFLDTLGAG